jgi:hypothetical protein
VTSQLTPAQSRIAQIAARVTDRDGAHRDAQLIGHRASGVAPRLAVFSGDQHEGPRCHQIERRQAALIPILEPRVRQW